MNLRPHLFAAAFALVVLACSLLRAAPARPAPPKEAEKEHWRQHGRTLPAPELLQPTLDPELPAYRPQAPGALRGTFRGTSSDVLRTASTATTRSRCSWT